MNCTPKSLSELGARWSTVPITFIFSPWTAMDFLLNVQSSNSKQTDHPYALKLPCSATSGDSSGLLCIFIVPMLNLDVSDVKTLRFSRMCTTVLSVGCLLACLCSLKISQSGIRGSKLSFLLSQRTLLLETKWCHFRTALIVMNMTFGKLGNFSNFQYSVCVKNTFSRVCQIGNWKTIRFAWVGIVVKSTWSSW